jgi:hypothetical protein
VPFVPGIVEPLVGAVGAEPRPARTADGVVLVGVALLGHVWEEAPVGVVEEFAAQEVVVVLADGAADPFEEPLPVLGVEEDSGLCGSRTGWTP